MSKQCKQCAELEAYLDCLQREHRDLERRYNLLQRRKTPLKELP